MEENKLENTGNNNTPSANTELEKRIKALEEDNRKLRDAVTNASADASRWKKDKLELENQLKSKMTEEERTKAEQDAAAAAMHQELEALRAERNVANHKAQLLSIGFDGELAEATAKAINDGDTANLFDGIRKFIASHDKAVQEQNLRTNPTLPGGKTTPAVTKEQFDKMGYTERVKVYQEHPDLYKEFTRT